jgi:hypothetical protein
MTKTPHVQSSNYRNGVEKEKKLKASIREAARKKVAEEVKPYVPPLMPKLDTNGRPIFNCSSSSPVNAPSPTGVRSGMPFTLGNTSVMTELGEGSWMRRRAF